MKNYIDYYYNLDVCNIHKKNNKYIFKINDINYLFYMVDFSIVEIQKVYNFSQELFNKGIYTNRIILNKDNNIFTNINNNNYILIAYYDYLERKITINDIIYFNNLEFNNNEIINWAKLWENKMDYFEYQMNQFGLKNPNARESFGYFSGYVETGIMLFNNMNLNNMQTVISHKRINSNQNIYYLYDPFNLIIDYKPRDIAEYFKSQLVNKKNMTDIVINFLEKSGYNNNELKLFFIRMLYPSFYFDIFEDVMNNKLDDNKLLEVINIKNDYEKFIINLYNYISRLTDIPRVEWFIY